MKTIFLFIATYVNTSDFLQTKFVAALAERNKVIVFLPSLDNVRHYPQSPNLIYKLWQFKEEQEKHFWGRMKLLRLGLINEFDQLKSIQIHYQTSFKDWKRKALRWLSKISLIKIKADHLTRLEVGFCPQNQEFNKLVKEYQPEIVLTATPGFTDLDAEVIVLAKQKKIKTAAINFSWDNLTTNAKHIRKTDYLVAWNEIMKEEAMAIHHYPSENVFVSGIMRFDYYFDADFRRKSREQFLMEKGLDPSLKTLLLTTTSHGVYPYHEQFLKNLLKLRDEQKSIPFTNIFVRVHPKDDLQKYLQFQGLKNFQVEIAGKEMSKLVNSRHKIEMDAEDSANLKNTLKYCDVEINYSSTITIEAFIFDKPVINIGFTDQPDRVHYQYEHYKKIVDSGGVKLARNMEEMRDYINLYLADASIDREARRLMVKKFIAFDDGLAYKRNVEFIEKMLVKD